MRFSMLGWVLSAMTFTAALIGCGGNVTCDPAACNSGGSGGSGGTGGVGGGSHAVCGGISGATCPPDEYCHYGDNSCGADDSTGECVTRPQVCPLEATPDLCGCDGLPYANECAAHAAGTDVSGYNFGCSAPPPPQYPCGNSACDFATNYCEMTTSDTPPMTTTYACKPLPAECGASPTCACVATVMCGSSCLQSSDGSLTVTCWGG